MFFSPCAFPIFLSCPPKAFKRKSMLISVFLQAGQHPQSLGRSMWPSTLTHLPVPRGQQSCACSFPQILLCPKAIGAGCFLKWEWRSRRMCQKVLPFHELGLFQSLFHWISSIFLRHNIMSQFAKGFRGLFKKILCFPSF